VNAAPTETSPIVFLVLRMGWNVTRPALVWPPNTLSALWVRAFRPSCSKTPPSYSISFLYTRPLTITPRSRPGARCVAASER
jgi:hypothetical protein